MSTLPAAIAAYNDGDYDRARELLLPLATEGDAEAQSMVGSIYQLGLGSAELNEEEAEKWYALASTQGHGLATNNLATLIGATDVNRAKALYELARQQGFIHAPTNYPDYL